MDNVAVEVGQAFCNFAAFLLPMLVAIAIILVVWMIMARPRFG